MVQDGAKRMIYIYKICREFFSSKIVTGARFD